MNRNQYDTKPLCDCHNVFVLLTIRGIALHHMRYEIPMTAAAVGKKTHRLRSPCPKTEKFMPNADEVKLDGTNIVASNVRRSTRVALATAFADS